MEIIDQIKSNLQEAELYRGQGLLFEAKEKYLYAGQLIRKNEHLLKNKQLLVIVTKKIRELNDEINRVENAPHLVAMPEQVQDIIKTKFSFSQDENTSALEGAVALAKFGQFERALTEFNELIQKESIRIDAAKNIIRCHMALDTLNDAVSQYEKWCDSGLFSMDQLNKLRLFLQGILDKKEIDILLADPKMKEPLQETAPSVPEEIEIPEVAEAEETGIGDILDISSVAITLPDGPKKGQTIEFDVSFQSGNVINLIISSKDKELIEGLTNGINLNDVQFFSPIAMFNGTGVVSSKAIIDAGPKQGDYSLDIKIKSI